MSATEKLYESSSSLGNESELSLSLTPRSLVNLSIDVYLSQNDYPVQELNGLFLLPKYLSYNKYSLLVLLLSM